MISSLYIFGGWVIRVAMIPVVARRHRPYVAMAWLAPIFLFPFVGTLMYLWLTVLGLERSTGGHRRVREEVERDDQLREQRAHRAKRDFAPQDQPLVELAERLSTKEMGGFPVLAGNAAELLDRPGQAVDHLIAEIDRAEHHVHLIFFIFQPDATGKRVADALAQAAARGVRCRLLIDAWASRAIRGQLAPWMKERGIELHPVLPIQPLRQPLSRIDVRNHRKIAVIDGRVAFTGSTNIHDPGYNLDAGVWHQASVRVEGPCALQLQLLFVEDWYFATGEMLQGSEYFPEPRRPGEVAVQMLPDGPSYGLKILQHVLVQSLQQADERITITTPYFIPDEPLLIALRLAALRGVEVDLVLPRRSDRRSADAAGRAYYDPLLEAGIRIHRHPSGIVHAKTISIDERLSIIGTANLDRRSLFLNYEVVLLIYDREFTQRLRESQKVLLAGAAEVDRQEWARRPESAKVLEHTVRLLSPVL